jgi:hypothetical protein
VGDCHFSLATLLYRKSSLEDARKHAQTALVIAQRSGPHAHAKLAARYGLVGKVNLAMGRGGDAKAAFLSLQALAADAALADSDTIDAKDAARLYALACRCGTVDE